MAVPDTNTFSLQDVVDEVNPTTDDLIDSFADATSALFDATYSGAKDRLYNFRNYNAVSYTAFTLRTSGFSTSTGACDDLGGSTTRYHDGPGGTPRTNDSVYTDGSGTPFNGGGNWYHIPSTDESIQINSSGLVTSLVICP